MLMEPIYNLPRMQFVGGETQDICFNLKTTSGANYATEGYDVVFSVREWGDREEDPILIKETNIKLNDTGTASVIEVRFEPEDTVYLDGQYIYQIMIFGDGNLCEIPGQGILNVIKNIHPGYFTR